MARRREEPGRVTALDPLIEGGLALYSRGDLDGALGKWRHVLDLDPQNRRAESYVRYVEEHYETLARRFVAGVALEAGEARDGSEVLEMEAAAADEVEAAIDGYEAIELELDDGSGGDYELDLGPAGPRGSARGVGLGDLEDRSSGELEGGWTLSDGWVDPVGVAPRELGGRAPSEPVVELSSRRRDYQGDDSTTAERGGPRAAGEGGSDFDLSELGLGATGSPQGLDLSELPARAPSGVKVSFRRPGTAPPVPAAASPRGKAESKGAPETRLTTPLVRGEDTAPTTPGPGAQVRSGDFTPPPDFAPAVDLTPPPGRTRESGDDELTLDRRAIGWSRPPARPAGDDAGDGLSFDDESVEVQLETVRPTRPLTEGEEETREKTAAFRRASPSAPPPAQAAPTRERVPIASLRGDLTVELDAAAPPADDDDGLRARLTWLMDRARVENQRRNHARAVAAVDLALDERPDSALAQKLVHRNRDLLFEVYRDFLGDLSGVPVLAVPFGELARRSIDHRAAFLLSRIDGGLSFEDLLDIAGMARLEAYRHLCCLMLDGIIDVR